MIDLTPLDIRKKRGDFGKSVRGYDREEVDHFLELTAERLEEVVKENLALRERAERLEERVRGLEGREKAVQEALVTAQNLRDDMKAQAQREAETVMREAQAAARGVRDDAKRFLEERRRELGELARVRTRFLKGLRTFLERELDAVEVEEGNPPPADFDATREGPAPVPLDSLLKGDESEAVDDEEAAALEGTPAEERMRPDPGGEQASTEGRDAFQEGEDPHGYEHDLRDHDHDLPEQGPREGHHPRWEFEEPDRRDA